MKRAISVILSLLLLVSVMPVAFAADDGAEMDWAALNAALKAGGEITLQNNVAAPDGAGALSVPKSATVTLDLNGYTVDRGLDSAKKKGCVIEVLGDLTVTDTSTEQTGAITGGYTDGTGGGVWVRSDGRFTLTAAIARYAELKAAAEAATDPTDPGNNTEPANPVTPAGDNVCKWDNADHGTSLWGRIVKFFHSVLYFFAHLFGIK